MSGIVNVDTLLFNVRLCIRYHNRRRSWFDTLNLGANAASVILSALAIAALRVEADQWAVWCALAITVISGFNLVLRTSERARQHHDLARRFNSLEQKVLPAREDQYAALYADKLAIEADEPPPLNVLGLMCHNDQISAEGIERDRRITLWWWQRLLAQVADLPPEPVPPPPRAQVPAASKS